MSRIARVVVPGIPHHIVQRGNRRQRVFFKDSDRSYYLRLLKKYSVEARFTIWAYCLMPNHVHILGVPATPTSLAEVMSIVHWKYAFTINLRHEWRGSLWQGRFYSCPLDDPHLFAATRYIERNPVRAKLVARAEEYPWSSAQPHVNGAPDDLLDQGPLVVEITDWKSFVNEEESEDSLRSIRKHLMTGRPFGDDVFISRLEKMTGRILKKMKPGRKKDEMSQNIPESAF
jgi:putative transposase